MSKLKMPPEERTLDRPKGGWQKGVYLVKVSFQPGNPIHSALLYAPFVRQGHLKNETLFNHTWEREHRIRDLHYLEIVGYSEELSGFLL